MLFRYKRSIRFGVNCTVNFKDPEKIILVISEITHLDIEAVISFCGQRY